MKEKYRIETIKKAEMLDDMDLSKVLGGSGWCICKTFCWCNQKSVMPPPDTHTKPIDPLDPHLPPEKRDSTSLVVLF